MTDIVIPDNLVHLVGEVQASVIPGPEGHGIDIGDSETSWIVQLDGATYTIERMSRGHLGLVELRTTDLDLVWIFLTLRFGFSWRWNAWRTFLHISPGESRVPANFTLTQDDRGRHTLAWEDDTGRRTATDLGLVNAVEVAWALPHSLDDVIASFKDLDGHPAFPQGDARAWER